MTRFIDMPTMSALVNQLGATQLLAQLCQCIEDDFKRWPLFDKSARLASHSDVGVIELMPASDGELYGFKYVNGHPSNTAKGLSTVMAFGALADVATGYPMLLAELTLSTAFRTAATSVMAAKALCRPNANSMAMIGCGAQSEFQAIAFHTLLGINDIRIYDIDAQAMQKFITNLAGFPALNIKAMPSTAQAVKGADIVTTVTADKAWATILTPDMVEPGMHINGIGGDCPGKTEIHKDVLTRSKIFVEYEPQTRVEGDIQQLDPQHPVTELWQVLTGNASGRDNDEQITLFDSVGFAMEDFSTLRFLHQAAMQYNLGKDIELIPALDDPKDLFAALKSSSNASASSNIDKATNKTINRTTNRTTDSSTQVA